MVIFDSRYVHLFISSKNGSKGAQLEIECQDDLTESSGKDAAITKFKNGTHSSVTASGYTWSFTTAVLSPQTAGHAAIDKHDEDGSQAYIWIKGENIGDRIVEGPVRIVIESTTYPISTTDDPSIQTVKITQDGPLIFSKVVASN